MPARIASAPNQSRLSRRSRRFRCSICGEVFADQACEFNRHCGEPMFPVETGK